MKLYLIHTAMICSLFAVDVYAQLVSVECCHDEDDLLKIGHCTSGPNATELPEDCQPPGHCVLGFGANTELMDLLCAAEPPQLPDEPRVMCTSWVVDDAPVVDECVASAAVEINLFTNYDTDRDGDLDLRDVAAFQELFHGIPNPTQSDAMLVRVECCFPEASLLSLGLCLSGPGVLDAPPACDSRAVCTLGFSDTVQVGDFMYRLCRPESTTTIGPSDFFCSSWAEEGAAIVQSCEATEAFGVGSWLVFDDDNDGDLDLLDFANLQRIFESAPER
jgi:hypothetical protein